MGADDDVGHVPEGALRGEGLLPEDVGGEAAEVTRLECPDEGGLVDDGAPGDVDEYGPLLHGCELLLPYEAAGLLGEGADEDHVVGLAEHGVEVSPGVELIDVD